MTAPDRIITISHCPEGFAVCVTPPVDGDDLDQTFADHRRARGWAGGLRMTRGWRIVDLASDAVIKDMMGGEK